MTTELTPIDVRELPELARLVDEVHTTRKPRRIVRDGEDVTLLTPAPVSSHRPLRDWRPRPEDLAAAIAIAGAWQDQLDRETFKRERRELQIDDKRPRNL